MHSGGRDARPKTHCPRCNFALGNELEIAAFDILKEAGSRFRTEVKTNRQEAFDNFGSDIAGNLSVLVAGRLATLDGVAKMLLSIHTMLGAPKIEAEGGESPMERIEAFLTGSDEVLPPAAKEEPDNYFGDVNGETREE